jgi:ATP-dependent protease HslVU (ClpYQ) peptidase subunit
MTVCIAAYCTREKTWVGAADSLLSVGDMAGDSLTFKIRGIGNNWIAMSAGNDVSPVDSIVNHVSARLKRDGDSLAILVDAFRQAYRSEIIQSVETDLLSRFQMDITEFKREGNNTFGPEIFSRMVYQIQETNVDLSFLVVGFDGNQERIFKVSSPGRVAFYDSLGFWAIGSGETAALAILFGCQSPIIFKHLPKVVAKVAQAKFVAERVPGVGERTTMFLLKQDSSRKLLQNDALGDLREEWEKLVVEDTPETVVKVAAELLKKSKPLKMRKPRKAKSKLPKAASAATTSTPQTSGGQQ